MSKRTAYNLDSLLVRGEFWRAHGWAVDSAALVAAELRTESDERFPLTVGITREDVRAHRSNAAHADSAGFFGFGTGWPKGAGTVELHLAFEDGSSDAFEVTNLLNQRRLRGAVRQRLGVAWFHLRRGEYELLAAKVLRTLERSYPKRLPRPAPSVAGTPLSLVIDHDLGGGANKFSWQLMEDLRKSGKNPVRLVYSVSRLRFELLLAGRVFAFETLDDALARVAQQRLNEIHLNSSVSYPSNVSLLNATMDLARAASAPIYCYVHDYYAACPSFRLFDWQERYCGVPDAEVCTRQCLPQINDPFVRSQSLSDISAWRAEWKLMLLAAHEIRFFSQSSHNILRRAFPDLPAKSCVVSPPRAEEVTPTVLRPQGLTIGIVGELSLSKGAKRVRELCEHIAHSNAVAKLVIVGTSDLPLDYSFVRNIGPYDSSRLGPILAQAGVGVAFFPSIWPETFSYVISELMQQRLPVVAFDLGAPAERLASYAPSSLLPVDTSPEVILSELARLAVSTTLVSSA